MPVMTEIDGRPAAAVTATPAARRRARQSVPVLAMVIGLAVMALAALVMTRAGDDRGVGAAEPAVDPSAITLSARDVSVVTQVYEPGEDSGWHAHSGIHAVAVISGMVTVYDDQCRSQTLGPGQSYVGGQERHLVANRTDTPATMAVTYLSPSAPTKSTEHRAAPLGCG